ncbi:2-oxoglutarate dehydrogenase complex dihydrolipoyllysine-residue succinyltransferase [Capnocytophaga canimorsus]|uniref:Dihydrolipoyllysine-residue succinyltransferase component of 2-oxoglutarate dehydrogenase complex n=1 Tax=Capnocytophaga canimorsus (strain 5) TaxID=860228 RepID=F9YQE8_CAPCC|nr:2-oxoglutarate dehydrogenase complex component E2 [Capnocytophaga canimorsus Cc5]AWL78976.1 2-oxoglutarate dehydrogenase complex dihydrolipoyllysine-residue succinyltransferase [Capnocytophaga canimorsus]AYW37575.1 2-oxoglutarate dehydrogenase complex dihydrolipoyllysine-residue succinyltransferase [Capnocytophaga canimorsus]GIM57618.1 dihydrolipoyllysine-residue succinyltransferase component of 2-oxoglutarate dehydrogenase complex [Capnocytophaga canimorsus]VEJ19714.1 Dihydrolipoyllysine-re
MILEMKVPSPGESITEVEIARWLVKTGDYVEKNQTIAEVDSDKATLELPAEASGVITLQAEEGDAVAVGQVVCLIDTSAEKTTTAAPTKEQPKVETPKPDVVKTAPAQAEPQPTYASNTPSPAAKKILAEKNISNQEVKGTGKAGRITKADALTASKPAMGTPSGGNRAETRTKMSMLRRKVAERLVSAKNETAMLTTFNEVDMSAIFQLRNQYKDAFKDKHNVGLGFMSFFTLAVVRALKLFPDVNSMIDGQDKVTYNFYDISIAVSGPKGLMVPVIRNAENLSFRGVEAEVKRLALRARDGQITVDEMTGGTFTITNGGVFGSMLSTPIINPPQSGILGMHNIVERPVVKNGQIVVAPVMYVALSYDHRIIDGRESVGFLVAVKEALENPVELLMNGDVKSALEL